MQKSEFAVDQHHFGLAYFDFFSLLLYIGGAAVPKCFLESEEDW
jgi:hypothetical protein